MKTDQVVDIPISLLLVEDDEIEVMGFERALKGTALASSLHTARNGQEALALLRDQAGRDNPPWVILLDINMPMMNGFEFLEALRADRRLADTTVFILTTSQAEEDLSRARSLQAAGYIVKSGDRGFFTKVIDLVNAYRAVAVLG